MTELSRLDWHKRARSNLRKYLTELEADLALRSLGNRSATEQLIVEVKRRLGMLDQLIADAESGAARLTDPPGQ